MEGCSKRTENRANSKGEEGGSTLRRVESANSLPIAHLGTQAE